MLTQQRILRPNHCATFVLLIRVCVTLKIYCTQNKVKKVLSVAADCSYVCTHSQKQKLVLMKEDRPLSEP